MINWLKSLFSSSEPLEPADLSVLKADMHSHLIPAIDDGSKSLEDSLEMIRKFKALGYQKLITTPHVMSDFYKNDPESILGGLEKLKQYLEEQAVDIRMEAAAEYYLDERLQELVEAENLLTFGDKQVLFELPFIAEPPNLKQVIFEMQTRGYKPILAHPERYGFWYKDFDRYVELHDQGVQLQLNMLSLIGHYSPQTQKIAERLIDEELISFLGSDCHNAHHLELIEQARRTPYFHKLLDSGKLKNSFL
jgi:tyrosine-protein phosphatase YwqE